MQLEYSKYVVLWLFTFSWAIDTTWTYDKYGFYDAAVSIDVTPLAQK